MNVRHFLIYFSFHSTFLSHSKIFNHCNTIHFISETEVLRFVVSCFLAFSAPWCFLYFNLDVFPHPLRGPWRSSWGFLWLLFRTLPRRYLCGDVTKEDFILCSEPPHPMCAPLLNDPVGLLAPCQLWGEDQPWWGTIRRVRRTGGFSMRKWKIRSPSFIEIQNLVSCCKLFSLSHGLISKLQLFFHNFSLSTLLENLKSTLDHLYGVKKGWDGGKQRHRKDKGRKGVKQDERLKSNEFS